jgi:hypothetical protein
VIKPPAQTGRCPAIVAAIRPNSWEVRVQRSDWLSQSATRPAGIGDVGRDVSGDP